MKKSRRKLMEELLQESNSELKFVEGIGFAVGDKIGWLEVGKKK